MISKGLLRRWTNPNRESGYLIYTPHQAEVLKNLMQSGRYGLEELRHIMSDWDDYLEAIIMQEPAYDDNAISDYEHFVRRAHEMLAFLSPAALPSPMVPDECVRFLMAKTFETAVVQGYSTGGEVSRLLVLRRRGHL